MSRAVADGAYVWIRQGRSRGAALAVGGIWIALVSAAVFLDAAPWIAAGAGLFTLPALYDLAANPSAGVVLNGRELRWFSGNRHARVDLRDIDHIRLDTRIDFSVRATALLRSGQKLRLPFESTPPHRTFEAACTTRGIRVMRHHFSPFV